MKFLLILLACGALAAAENPLGLPEYAREYRLAFGSPEETAAAHLTLSPLPEGKRVLFSCRWDDSTDKHLKTVAAMRESGCRGTFYLCQAGPNYYAKTLPRLLADGNSVGNHTLHHPRLTRLAQAELWNEILANRYEYEARTAMPVTAFALPFCAWREKDDPAAPRRIGAALRNAGMLGGPEYFPNLGRDYGYPEGCYAGSALTTPGDDVPSESRFDADVARFLAEGARHITLGMHSNHSDAGLAALRRILAKSAARPDWLACNENEAIARLLAARMTRLEKLESAGSTARFRLTGPTPAALGHAAPLAATDGKRWFVLPHTLPMPKAIALFVNRRNASGFLGSAPQTDLFRAGLAVDPQKGSAQLLLKNTGTRDAEALEVTLRLPGFCTPALQRRRIERLAAGAAATVDFRFSLAPDAAGNTPAAAEVDLRYGDDVYRLWAVSHVSFGNISKENCAMNSKVIAAVGAAAAVSAASGQAVLQESFDAKPGRSCFSNRAECYEPRGVNGSYCAVFRGDPAKSTLLTASVASERVAGKTVVLEAQVSGEALDRPEPAHFGTKVTLYYRTAAGKQNWLDAPKIHGTADWKRVEVRAAIPADATAVQIQIGIQRAAGTFRVDDLKLRIAEPDGAKESQTVVTGSIDRADAIYKRGEPMKFQFRLLDNGRPAAGRLRLTRLGDDGKKEQQILAVTAESPAEYVTALDAPGFVMVRAEQLDDQGNVPRRAPRPGVAPRPVQYGLGAAVEPEKLVQGVPEPKDFDLFWERQKAELTKVPLQLLENRQLPGTDRVDVYDVKLACAGPRPVSGYLTVPKAAGQGKKFPARLRFDGYSVQSAPLYTDTDAITFSVNPHGIENGRDADYYRALQRGELAEYGFKKLSNQSPESCYFRTMILRGLRAAEFLRGHSAWNGRDFYIVGGSQGAFQSAAVTALTPWATRCELAIPWFCDLGGIQVGRIRGWRPDSTPALGYFDTVNFARRIQCPTDISAGLSDYVCPPSGVQVLYNNLRCRKSLTFLQGFDHAVYLGFDRDKTARHTVKADAQPLEVSK